jgi:hypothetical protein
VGGIRGEAGAGRREKRGGLLTSAAGKAQGGSEQRANC